MSRSEPGTELVAGVDEAGRGPLAGPVVVAAVILPARFQLPGLGDSKRLKPAQRERLDLAIREQAICWSLQVVGVDEIDQLNILQATLLGMQRAVQALQPAALLAQIDGNRAPGLPCRSETVVGGDGLVPCISAASILAKVHRDRLMLDYHRQYPGYGFDQHKGYPTARHLGCLQELGPCPIHRRSFAPVGALLNRR
jgi:ribonuclease HII